MTKTKEPPELGVSDVLGHHTDNPPTPRQDGELVIVYHYCPACRGRKFVTSDAESDKCSECRGNGKSAEAEAEYLVAGEELRIKGQYEQWCRRNAMREIAQMEADGEDPESMSEWRQAHITLRTAGAFTWNGRVCRQARQDFPGILYLFYLLLRRCQPKMTEVDAKRIWLREPQQCALALRLAQGNWQSPEDRLAGATQSPKKNGKPVEPPSLEDDGD